MANDDSAKTDPLVQLRALMKEAAEANATSREQLQVADRQLSHLNLVLDQLGQVRQALQPIADQLSDMTLETARRVWAADRAGEPFLALVGQLSEVARQVGVSVGDLDSYLRRAAVALNAAITRARNSGAELERILPALQAVNSTPPPVPGEKVVAFELKISRTEGEGSERKPPSIFDAWPGPLVPDGRTN